MYDQPPEPSSLPPQEPSPYTRQLEPPPPPPESLIPAEPVPPTEYTQSPQYLSAPAEPAEYTQSPQEPYHTAQPAQQEGGSKWLAVVSGVVLVFVVFGIVAALLIARSYKANSPSSQTSITNYGNRPSGAPVGQALVVNNVECTLVSVQSVPGGSSVNLRAGYEFIVVHVRLMNIGNAVAYYNVQDFRVKDASGSNIAHSILAPNAITAYQELHSGKITAAYPVVGDIVFRVPIEDHTARLVWSPTIVSRSWNLGL